MGDEFDVDDLLEAPYKVKNDPEVSLIICIHLLRGCSIFLFLTNKISNLIKKTYFKVQNINKPTSILSLIDRPFFRNHQVCCNFNLYRVNPGSVKVVTTFQIVPKPDHLKPTTENGYFATGVQRKFSRIFSSLGL
eukprot:TRINITY_DN2872_c0_g1_i4.p2 TRINITY_DN2872_c0_g1~~TRINITY_DN2872_c0_g1_i4.p2  ORF type:complete len:135 (-),score=1.48 TRINITY_DN2872_c0_g1_i4:979-1383(-)